MDYPSDGEVERKDFRRIVWAFKNYRTHSLERVAKTENYLLTLPEHHRALLDDYRQHLTNVRSCIENNDDVIKLIIQDAANMFEQAHSADPANMFEHAHSADPANMFEHAHSADPANMFEHAHSADPDELDLDMNPQPVCSVNQRYVEWPCSDLHQVYQLLRQFVRDWSEEGLTVRQACYHPVIDEIVTHFPTHLTAAKDVKVLVPGAGLGRLAFEIARRGYTCQGNEFSLFMLFASNFVLNKCRAKNAHVVYPWVHQYSNYLKAKHQTKSVTFPDVNPGDLPADAHFTMVPGDFLKVYTEHNDWDCVATCFFIDCAHNIVQFIETIYNILKPGGLWVNLGPLLYHFSEIEPGESIEPSFEFIKTVIKGIGFELLKEETNVKTTYAQNPDSMIQYYYDSIFFVCRKPNPTQ